MDIIICEIRSRIAPATNSNKYSNLTSQRIHIKRMDSDTEVKYGATGHVLQISVTDRYGKALFF